VFTARYGLSVYKQFNSNLVKFNLINNILIQLLRLTTSPHRPFAPPTLSLSLSPAMSQAGQSSA